MKFKRKMGEPLPPEFALAITASCHELYERWRVNSPRMALKMRLAHIVMHDRALTGVRVLGCERKEQI
jgi:hypothetical protein